MSRFVLLAALLSAAHASVCDSIRSEFKNSACCGDGGGAAFCAAPSFDAVALMQKIDTLLALNGGGGTPCKESASNLGEACFCPLTAEVDTLGVWPPSSKDASLLVDADGYPSYLTNASRFPHAGPTRPPYFALCSSASQMVDVMFGTCQVDDYADFVAKSKSAETFAAFSPACRSGMKMIAMFAIVLQFEYLVGTGAITIGSTYAHSLRDAAFDLPGAVGSVTLDPLTYVGLEGSNWTGTPIPLTFSTYAGHLRVVLGDVVATSYPPDTLLLLPSSGLYAGYPEHFDICLASRQMFDYMTQVPGLLFPDTLAAYTASAKCVPKGMLTLEVQSKILGIEKNVTSGDVTSCPSVASLRADVKRASQAIRMMSPAFVGNPCQIGETTVESVCTQASPFTADAMYYHRHDAFYMRSFWITFLEVHVRAIDDACAAHVGESYTVSDPWGMAEDVVVSLSELFTMRNEYEAAWPRTVGTSAPPHETAATVSAPTSFANLTFREYAYPQELVCEDDPVGRVRGFSDMMFLTGSEFLGLVTPQLQVAFGTASAQETVCVFCTLPCDALGPVVVDPGVVCRMTDIFPASCRSCPGANAPDCV